MQSVWVEQFVGRDAGNYRIDRLLGQGPVSSFYEARHSSGQKVILTLFKLPETFSLQARIRFLTRFHQEGEALVQLKHPAILPVQDYGEFSGYAYLATPFVTGNSLAQGLQARGPMPYELVLAVLKQVAEGLDHAHSKEVMHGALSPANILVGKEGGEIQIAGFGIARILAMQGLEPYVPRLAHQLNVAEEFLGLPEYMAPEIVLGESFSASADIFALGILLFELLSGRPPFAGDTPFDVAEQYLLLQVPSLSALVPTLPPGVDAVVRKALAYSPEQRFQSAGEFVRAFEQALQAAEKARGGTSVVRQPASLIGMLQTPLPGLNPFAWWANASMTRVDRSARGAGRVAEERQRSRRRAIALLSMGGIVVAGLGGGGFELEQYWHMQKKASALASTRQKKPPQVPSPTVQPAVTTLPQQSTPTPQPTAKPSATAQPPTPITVTTPVTAPTPKPTSTGSSSSKGKKKRGKKG